jgi:Fe-S cluster assembly iron-binding protein IscA
MLEVTSKAVSLLKAAKTAQGAPREAGIRIVRGTVPENGRDSLAVGFAISDEPAPDDEEFEQDGLRVFVQDSLVEPLEGRVLDVAEADDGTELVFR